MRHTKKLLEMRREANLTSQQLAEAAGVPLSQEYAVEIGGFVDRATAEKVINAFSSLTHSHHTLDEFQINGRVK
jgi:hypothetical protein